MTDSIDNREDSAADGGWAAWRNLWQVPTILASIGLIGLAVMVAREKAPAQDWDGALDQVRELINNRELEAARDRLVGVLEPNLDAATRGQQARFHAIAADWIGVSQELRDASVPENNRRIDEQYRLAVELGLALEPGRIERWGRALADLNRLEAAEERVLELEALADLGDAEAGRCRNRLLRLLVERNLADESLSIPAMLARLDRYREDPRLDDADQAWAIDRQAALRIEQGDFQPAIDALMLDLRRLEHRQADLAPDIWGGFSVRLADASWRLGRLDDSIHHLEQSERLFQNNSPSRGLGLLIHARIDVERTRREDALPKLDSVVEEYPGTSLVLPARLLRAEVLASLGQHEDAKADYAAIRELLQSGASRGDVASDDVLRSLGDRRDAMVAMGELDEALHYARIAEKIFADAPGSMRDDVLDRVAAIHEQAADEILARGRAEIIAAAAAQGDEIDAASLGESMLPASVRAAAQSHLEQAAEGYMRHARQVLTQPGRESAFLSSLWAAAEAFERAGRPDEAIEAMETYLGGGDTDDPRRPEVMFRLARQLEAVGSLSEAATRYRQVIDEDPRTIGTRAHSPLARTLMALGRVSEADDVLLAVVEGRQAGDTVLTPDAADYRRALVDLGRLHYEQSIPRASDDPAEAIDDATALDRVRKAIERFDAALVRDPGAEDAREIRYWLADSHRRLAELLADRGGTPGERRSFELARIAHLETALSGYEEVIDAWGEREEKLLDRRRRAMLRNALVNRARTTYDLGRWEAAARLYDTVARRYADEHVSMQALVQIVNCYDMLGESQKATVAHRNALLRLEQLPDAAFDAADSLMDREAWSQWLRNRPAGQVANAGAVGGGEVRP